MSNARELEKSEFPNAADDFQYLPPKPPNPDLLTSSFSNFDLQSDKVNSSIAVVRRTRKARARHAEDLQGNSVSSADLQGNSVPSAYLQVNSVPSADSQVNSLPSADLQEELPSSADLQGEYRHPQIYKETHGQQVRNHLLITQVVLYLTRMNYFYNVELAFTEYFHILSFIEEQYDSEELYDNLTRDETIDWLKGIVFKFRGSDLLLSFQELLTSNVNEVAEFYPWTKDQVLYDQFVGALINIANAGKLTERTVHNLTFEGLLKLSPITSDGEKFYDSAKSRLSDEQFGDFIRAIRDANVSGAADKNNISSVLFKAENIFGTDNKDLFLPFRELVKLQLNYPREDDEDVVSTMAEFIRTS